MYYYYLAGIEVDFFKLFGGETKLGWWSKMSKNTTNVMLRIIEHLLAMRNKSYSVKYKLEQDRLLVMLFVYGVGQN